MYDVHSKHADDFISHEEILETLAYADENKTNEALIDSILEKARLRKGLSHREASVLLACPIEEKNQEIYRLAEQIKKDFYGNRIVMFAPLYLSNYWIWDINGLHWRPGKIPCATRWTTIWRVSKRFTASNIKTAPSDG